MRKLALYCCILLLTPSLGTIIFAQSTEDTENAPKAPHTANTPAPPAHYYHLDFVVEELNADGKPTNSRAYSTTASTNPKSYMLIRTETKVPVDIGPGVGTQRQFEWSDVHINIDVRSANEVGRQLALDLSADLVSLASSSDPSIQKPVTRQNKWQALVLVPVGKPTAVFKSDNLDGKGAKQLVVTATLLQ
jgi:hypothetical protein